MNFSEIKNKIVISISHKYQGKYFIENIENSITGDVSQILNNIMKQNFISSFSNVKTFKIPNTSRVKICGVVYPKFVGSVIKMNLEVQL
jgi:hypothetical protein